MRVTLIFAAYAVLVSAAPQNGIQSLYLVKRESPPEPEEIFKIPDSDRCGMSSPTRFKCPKGQFCVAEQEAGDGKGGICRQLEDYRTCGDELSCSQSGNTCIHDPRVKCPDGVDCDGGLCFSAAIMKGMGGQKQQNLKPVVCGGKTGVECAAGALCTGELSFARGTGVCTKFQKLCGYFNGPTCPDNTSCVPDPRIQCPKGTMDCVFSGICVRNDWIKTYGGGLKKTPKPTPGSSIPRCNISNLYQCPEKHICAAVEEVGDGNGGVCIPEPAKGCSNARGEPCASKGDVCVGDLRLSCPVGIDCGGGVCVPQKTAKALKLKQAGPRPLACDGVINGMKGCSEKDATCVRGFDDVIALCIKNPIKCGVFEDQNPPCPNDQNYYCVHDCNPGDPDCTGVCVREDWARRYGNLKAAPKPLRKPQPETKSEPEPEPEPEPTKPTKPTKPIHSIKPTKPKSNNMKLKRCRSSRRNECAEGEICLGERQFDDGLGGVCVPNPARCAYKI
ncbi:hypothetical protein TWF506_004178 [Arthrobotrys conoides]|uniref:Uncharacterized protein n=1 Tax=Arthrobotrys conoides TaxID=74498 RepID=A0AAN8P4Y5_9PEZI